jgi:rare lipoprotein A
MPMASILPSRGEASTYSDWFVNKRTANGETYTHQGYTAALVPQARWYSVPMGTLLQISANGRSVVVEVNDRGAGNGQMSRVLDLSRAAYAYLKGVPSLAVTDRTAGVVQLDTIGLAPAGAPLGPVSP